MNCGEFHEIFLKSYERFEVAATLFHNFHPQTSPVLWRILIAQAHFHRALKGPKSATIIKTLKIIPKEERIKFFDWRHIKEQTPDEKVLIDPFVAVETYLRDPRLGLTQFMESNGITSKATS